MATKTKRAGAPVKPSKPARKSASFNITPDEAARIEKVLSTYDTPPRFSAFVKACMLAGLASKERRA